jgi:electron transport complex protein RnfE
MSKSSTRLSDGLVRQNIVLMSGIAIGPVAVVANSFENAAALSVGFTIIAFLSIIACRFIPKKLVYTIRVIIYALIAGASVIPAYFAVTQIYGAEVADNLGVYLPILAVNPLILTKTETRFSLRPFHLMIIELAGYITGFNVVCIAVGIVRDILANRQIGELGFDLGFEVPAVSATFGGLMIVGLAAGLFRHRYTRAKENRAKKLEKEREHRKILEEL